MVAWNVIRNLIVTVGVIVLVMPTTTVSLASQDEVAQTVGALCVGAACGFFTERILRDNDNKW
ncbi:MAG: hypothetical protein JW384_03867 [Nitrosomonadaceae bacterium]|nr:hypothetical protein [Nitrosomonadaceae bacterium]